MAKRQKHVFTSEEIPHLWMHQTQMSARNSTNNLYFENETIFSYGSHFPIAKHVKNKSRKTAIIFTTRTYSVTTSGHVSMVRGAIPENIQVFNVPVVFASEPHGQAGHKTNLDSYVERINYALSKCVYARSSYSKQYQHELATELHAEAKQYASFFGLKLPKLPVVPALDSAQMEQIKQREVKRAAAKRAEATAARIEQENRDKERAEKWRNGENVGYFSGEVMLRINGEELETSKGARIPLTHALRGLKFVRSVIKSGKPYVRNGHTLHLGHYTIDRIDTDGTLTAGCHVISYQEIERIAVQLEAIKLSETE